MGVPKWKGDMPLFKPKCPVETTPRWANSPKCPVETTPRYVNTPKCQVEFISR